VVEITITNLKTFYKFTSALFDREDQAKKAAMIILGILKARSPRITEVARAIPKAFFASHKMIYWFLSGLLLRRRSCGYSTSMLPLSFVIPPRSLDSGEENPLRGHPEPRRMGRPRVSSFWSSRPPERAIPFWFGVFLSRTISQEESPQKAFLQLQVAPFPAQGGGDPLRCAP